MQSTADTLLTLDTSVQHISAITKGILKYLALCITSLTTWIWQFVLNSLLNWNYMYPMSQKQLKFYIYLVYIHNSHTFTWSKN